MGHLSGRSKPSSFEEYWRASKAWQSRGLPLASARALTNAGFLNIKDLQSANSLELAMIPRIGAKSLALLYELKGEKVPDVARLCGKAMRFRNMLNSGTDGPPGGSGVLIPPVAPLSQALGALGPSPVMPVLTSPAHPIVSRHLRPRPLRPR